MLAMSKKRKKVIPAFRVNDNEYAEIETRWKASGLSSRSDFLRQNSLKDIVQVNQNKRNDAKLIASIGALGNNLNQLSRNANIHGMLQPDEIERFNDLIITIQTILNGALNGSEYK